MLCVGEDLANEDCSESCVYGRLLEGKSDRLAMSCHVMSWLGLSCRAQGKEMNE